MICQVMVKDCDAMVVSVRDDRVIVSGMDVDAIGMIEARRCARGVLDRAVLKVRVAAASC